MSAIAKYEPAWMSAQFHHLNKKNYKFSREEIEKMKRDGNDMSFQGPVIASVLSHVGGGAAIGALIVPGIGAAPGAFIGAMAALVDTTPYVVLKTKNVEEKVYQEGVKKISQKAFENIEIVLEAHFQSARYLICPITSGFPKDAVKIKGEEYCYERQALEDHIANNGLVSPITRRIFTKEDVVPAKGYFATLGKMCHKILTVPERAQQCQREELMQLEALRKRCQNRCKNTYGNDKKRIENNLALKIINGKKYNLEMLKIEEEYNPTIPECPSDEEKED